MSSVSVQALVDECASVRSRSLLYALVDPYRANRPSRAQLLEVATAARGVSTSLAAAADEVERMADSTG